MLLFTGTAALAGGGGWDPGDECLWTQVDTSVTCHSGPNLIELSHWHLGQNPDMTWKCKQAERTELWGKFVVRNDTHSYFPDIESYNQNFKFIREGEADKPYLRNAENQRPNNMTRFFVQDFHFEGEGFKTAVLKAAYAELEGDLRDSHRKYKTARTFDLRFDCEGDL